MQQRQRANVLAWTDRYSVDISVFDEEHKELFSAAGALNRCIASGSDRSKLKDILAGLLEYFHLHCRHEEMYFADCNYPDAVIHTAKHAEFREAVEEFLRSADSADPEALAKSVLVFVQAWFDEHILLVDRKFCYCLIASGLRWLDHEKPFVIPDHRRSAKL